MAGIITVLGVVFASLFHLGTPEPKQTLEKFEYDPSNSMIWKDWFRLPAFYKASRISTEVAFDHGGSRMKSSGPICIHDLRFFIGRLQHCLPFPG